MASVRSWRLLRRIGLAVAIGAAFPYVDLAWKCREGFELTEACVWGKAYLPLTRGIALVVIAPIAFVVLTVLAVLWSRRR